MCAFESHFFFLRSILWNILQLSFNLSFLNTACICKRRTFGLEHSSILLKNFFLRRRCCVMSPDIRTKKKNEGFILHVFFFFLLFTLFLTWISSTKDTYHLSTINVGNWRRSRSARIAALCPTLTTVKRGPNDRPSGKTFLLFPSFNLPQKRNEFQIEI